MSERERFIAVKLDVVASRRARDRAALQALLAATTRLVNRTFARWLAASFIVTHGDEVQGMFKLEGVRNLLPCLETWVDEVRPYRVRFGVGVGALATPIQPQAIGMDGPCWYRAKEALDTAHKERKAFHIVTGRPARDGQLSAFANLLFVLRRGWTDRQVQAVRLLQSARTQAEAAAAMGVRPATFSNHLSGAHWQEYVAGRNAFMELLGDALFHDGKP